MMRTIHKIEEKLCPLRKLLGTSSYQRSLVVINVIGRELLSLPPRLGGLEINIFSNGSEIEYRNSRLVTKDNMKAIFFFHLVRCPTSYKRAQNTTLHP